MRRQSLTILSILSLGLLCSCSLVVDADKSSLDELSGNADVGDGNAPGDGDLNGPCTDDRDCSDDDPCNGEERCDADAEGADALTGCVDGEAPSCSDGIGCTADRCEPGEGCEHDADSTRCGDDVDCTVDVCDRELGCQHLPNDTRCDFCKAGATCDARAGCVGGTTPNNCSDGDACTFDQCDVATLECRHAGSCAPGPDACEDAAPLSLSAGSGIASGRFNEVQSSYDVACGARDTADAVYRLSIDTVSDVIIDATSSDEVTNLAVATDCSAEGFGLACAAAEGVARGPRLIVHRYDPAVHGQNLFVLVDAESRTAEGGYAVTVDVFPAADDQCDGEALTVTEATTVLGFMDARRPPNAWGESECSCQPIGGPELPEAILRVAGVEDGTLELSAQSDAFSPVLYARERCDGGGDNAELACASAFVPVTTNEVTLEVEVDERDDTFVFVDGGRDGAPYVLRSRP